MGSLHEEASDSSRMNHDKSNREEVGEKKMWTRQRIKTMAGDCGVGGGALCLPSSFVCFQWAAAANIIRGELESSATSASKHARKA